MFLFSFYVEYVYDMARNGKICLINSSFIQPLFYYLSPLVLATAQRQSGSQSTVLPLVSRNVTTLEKDCVTGERSVYCQEDKENSDPEIPIPISQLLTITFYVLCNFTLTVLTWQIVLTWYCEGSWLQRYIHIFFKFLFKA